MAWILLGLASMPHCETMKPRNFPDDTSNAQPGFRLYRNDARYQTSLADRLDGCFFCAFHKHVVHIYLDVPPNLLNEYPVLKSLI